MTTLLHNFDIYILALTETWLNRATKNANIYIEGYDFYTITTLLEELESLRYPDIYIVGDLTLIIHPISKMITPNP